MPSLSSDLREISDAFTAILVHAVSSEFVWTVKQQNSSLSCEVGADRGRRRAGGGKHHFFRKTQRSNTSYLQDLVRKRIPQLQMSFCEILQHEQDNSITGLRNFHHYPGLAFQQNFTLTPVTPASSDQNSGVPVVFNHVYNINVPAGTLCSTETDSTDDTELDPKDATVSSSHQTTEHTFDKENQIVLNHRISLHRPACGCNTDLPGLKDLISRMEVPAGLWM
ncbi:hypothetical protein LDENG_00068790 [Lucifuga dentata]|nr:hypothetical protein LDENG_00068790 [Lucifuga dentata]